MVAFIVGFVIGLVAMGFIMWKVMQGMMIVTKRASFPLMRLWEGYSRKFPMLDVYDEAIYPNST